tara:strand:+ start:1915 stop:2091 length:177 start_codon:yes stop_codon:yes gene_type:complete
MSIQKKLELLEVKPFKVTCKKSDYSASYPTKEAAFAAKNRHQEKFEDHEVIVTYTVII